MIYVTSDLHGCPIEKFMVLLQKVDFNDSDFCFVLGDVIDRGSDGIEILKWMMVQPNVELLLGNHEALLLSNTFLFDIITENTIENLAAEQMDLYTHWMGNGAEPTLKALCECDFETRKAIIEYLKEAPLYETVAVNGREFFLCHSGLDNFSINKK